MSFYVTSQDREYRWPSLQHGGSVKSAIAWGVMRYILHVFYKKHTSESESQTDV